MILIKYEFQVFVFFEPSLKDNYLTGFIQGIPVNSFKPIGWTTHSVYGELALNSLENPIGIEPL